MVNEMDVAGALQVISNEVASVCLRKVREDEALISSGLIDSVGLIELATALEGHFQVSVPFEDLTMEHFDSVRAIAKYLSSKA